jgi:hypothetical protein
VVIIQAGRPVFRRSTPGRGERIFALVFRPALGPTQPTVQWVPGVISLDLKRGRIMTLTTHPIWCRGQEWLGSITKHQVLLTFYTSVKFWQLNSLTKIDFEPQKWNIYGVSTIHSSWPQRERRNFRRTLYYVFRKKRYKNYLILSPCRSVRA